MLKPQVQFLLVRTNAEKLKTITSIVTDVFLKGEKILILTPSLIAAEYLDKYLWQDSEESFLPHCISHSPTKERIVITTKHENLNAGKVLFNLNPTISSISHGFEMIYDLDDNTSQEKALSSKERKQSYQRL